MDDDGYCDDVDCDVGDPEVHPGAEEICDGLDNDCDAEVDEADAVDATTWYLDADSDGYGDPDSGTPACDEGPGWVGQENATDCDDGDASSYPGATERCDGVDNDCDGVADLLGHWPFDAGSGAVAYDSGPLALDGDVVDASWTTGVTGGALDFNGTSAHVLLDYDELAPEQGLSLSAWVQPASLQASTWDTVISRGASSTGDLGCCSDSYYLGYYRYGLSLYSNVSSSYTDGELLDGGSYASHVGSWHHLVGTWEGATGAQAIYVDGVRTASGTAYTYLTYDGTPTRIGSDTNSGSGILFFDGVIDEVKILDRAMDAGQVAADYADGWPF